MRSWVTSIFISLLFSTFAKAEVDDVYGYSCLYQASLYNYGCVFPEQLDVYDQGECLCLKPAFMETAVGCFETYATSQELLEEAYVYLGYVCPPDTYTYNLTQLIAAVPTLPKNLTAQQLAGNITEGFIIPWDVIKYKIAAEKSLNRESRKPGVYGAATLAFWGGIVAIKSIHHFCFRLGTSVLKRFDGKLIRRIRSEFFLPASGSYHHSTPKKLFGFSFNIPIRSHTLIISAFILLNLLLVFVGIDIPEQGLYSESELYSDFVAYRSGILCMDELILVLLFAGRNNLLLWVTGWPMDTFNVFHKWIARIMVANAVIHSIGYTIYYIEMNYFTTMWLGVPGIPWWNWGIAATIIFCVMLVQSVHFFRQINYEIFLYVHIIFTVFAIPALWIHIIPLEGMKQLYATIAIWSFDHLIRILRLLWSGVTSKADVRMCGDNMMEFKINYSQNWKPYPGSYIYIHILRPNRFWQSHPFTVVTSPRIEDNGKLVIYTRVKNGVTKYLGNYLEKQPDRSANVRVLVEGPYGVQHPVHHYDSAVLIAGGVGVTGIYPYVAALRQNQDKNQRITFIWCIRDEQPLSWFRDQLNSISEDPRIEVIIHITQADGSTPPEQYLSDAFSDKSVGAEEKKTSITSTGQIDIRLGQPNLKGIGAQIISETEGTLAFLVCGPNGMNDDVRQTVANNIVNSKNRVDFFEESFSW